MWRKRIRFGVLPILWSTCHGEKTLFDVGLISYINNFDDRGSSHAHFLYPTLSDDEFHSSAEVDLEYLFNEMSTTGYDLTVRATLNAPIAPGTYPIVAYLFGEGGFSLDSHTLLTQLAAMGFIVVASDMPEYRVGDTVRASDVQSHMGGVLSEIYRGCPLDAQGLCQAVDFDNIIVIGPSVVDATCTLTGWTKQGLHPSAQVVISGKVEVDADCHPLELDTQDISFIASGKTDMDSTFADEVDQLLKWTDMDAGMSAYFLGLSKVPSIAAFTDLCAISHKIRPIRHLAGTKSCADISEDDISDAQSIARVIISNILFHHFWDHPLTAPVDIFNPKDYPSYLYRAIDQGFIIDAIGEFHVDPTGNTPLPIPIDGGYHFRNPTILTILPLIFVGILYFTCGIGLCMSDCKNAKQSTRKSTSGVCFDGLIKQAFKNVFSPVKHRQHSFYPTSQTAEYHSQSRSPSTTPGTIVEHSCSSPRTVITYSTCDFLTGEKKGRSLQETPRSRRTISTADSVELMVRVDPSKANSCAEPLLHPCEPRLQEIVKKSGGYCPSMKQTSRFNNEGQKRDEKISRQEIYEALGSGTDTDADEIRPITNSELNKLLQM